MLRWLLLLVLSAFLGACGRFGFEPSDAAVGPQDDASSILPPVFAGIFVIDWSANFIEHVDLSNGDVHVLLTRELPIDIAVDWSGDQIYWTDGSPGEDSVMRAGLDGSEPEQVVPLPSLPQGIALDRGSGYVWWSGLNLKIQRARFDGTELTSVGSDIASPWGIAFDNQERRVYWTERGDITRQGIWRMWPDGSGAERIVDLSTDGAPFGIAIDEQNRMVYWTDQQNPAAIVRARLDGSGTEDIVTAGNVTPMRLAVDAAAGFVYWTDSGTNQVRRSDLDGSNVQNLMVTGLDRPEGIAMSP